MRGINTKKRRKGGNRPGRSSRRNAGITWPQIGGQTLLLAGSVPALFVGYLVIDGLSGHRIAASVNRSLTPPIEAGAADSIATVEAEERARTQGTYSERALDHFETVTIGDKITCAVESTMGGIMTIFGNPMERLQGEMLMDQCQARGEDLQRRQRQALENSRILPLGE